MQGFTRAADPAEENSGTFSGTFKTKRTNDLICTAVETTGSILLLP